MGRRGGEDYASFEGDDDSGGAVSFGDGPSSEGTSMSPEMLARAGPKSGGSSGRRHSRGGMSARSGNGSSHKRSHGRSKGFKFNAGSLREAAGSMLTVAVAGVVVCAIILYFTCVQAVIPQFYGALGAAMVVMFLLCFVAARLLGSE